MMTIGALTVFLAYLSKFFKPVQDLAKMSNTLAQTAVAMERVQTILDTRATVPERPNARAPGDLKGEITFDHVVFGYDPAFPVLRDMSFSIAQGQMVGVVGATGGGKSTVVSLIPRFYDPGAGQVKIDGVDLRDYKLGGLRSQIGFVLQDTVLFRGTVRDNIAYGRPMLATTRSSLRPSWRTRMSSSSGCLRATIHWSESVASRSPAANGSASASLARSSAMPRSLFSTSPLPLSTPNRKNW